MANKDTEGQASTQPQPRPGEPRPADPNDPNRPTDPNRPNDPRPEQNDAANAEEARRKGHA